MFFPFYVENHSLATIFCSKGIDSGSETTCLDQSFASLSSQILSRLSWHLKLFDVKLWHFSLVKLNNGLTSFTNSVTTSNVFVRHFNTSLRYSFAKKVLVTIVTDWWWDVRDLQAFSPGILGVFKALFSIAWILTNDSAFWWHSGLILFDQTLLSFYIAQQPSRCLLNPIFLANIELVLLS